MSGEFRGRVPGEVEMLLNAGISIAQWIVQLKIWNGSEDFLHRSEDFLYEVERKPAKLLTEASLQAAGLALTSTGVSKSPGLREERT